MAPESSVVSCQMASPATWAACFNTHLKNAAQQGALSTCKLALQLLATDHNTFWGERGRNLQGWDACEIPSTLYLWTTAAAHTRIVKCKLRGAAKMPSNCTSWEAACALRTRVQPCSPASQDGSAAMAVNLQAKDTGAFGSCDKRLRVRLARHLHLLLQRNNCKDETSLKNQKQDPDEFSHNMLVW